MARFLSRARRRAMRRSGERRPQWSRQLRAPETLEDRCLLSGTPWAPDYGDDRGDPDVVTPDPAPGEPVFVADRLIVRFTDDTSRNERDAFLASQGAEILKTWETTEAVLVDLPGTDSDILRTAAEWTAQEPVLFAEPDFGRMLQRLPDDPQYSMLWGMEKIDAPAAWDIATGTDVPVVVVIDSGIDFNHYDLAANLWRNPGEIPGDQIDNDGNGFVDDIVGVDTTGALLAPFDDNGHGTHVAGTIAAVGDNSLGVVGVNWDARIMAIKAFDAGGGALTSWILDAVDYMTMMKTEQGVNIVASNNSYGGYGYSQAMQESIQSSIDAGILFVAAAANDSINNDVFPAFPASYPLDGIISVAATDEDDVLADFSNFGANSVDLTAPGVNIWSTYSTFTDPTGYAYSDGTSMAAPHVTGVAVLLSSVDPTLTPQETKDLILRGVDPVDTIPDQSFMTVTGGRLNANNSLRMLRTEVRGSVWDDNDADGRVDPGEAGLADWTVFVDANRNGQWDPILGELAATTGSDGAYQIGRLTAGTHQIGLVVPDDWEQTLPNNGDLRTVTVAAGQSIGGQDFGARMQRGSIAGLKWRDIDVSGNTVGVRDPGEPGLAGVYIYIDLNNDHVPGVDEPSAVTRSDGSYALRNLRPNAVSEVGYTIREAIPPTMQMTFPNPNAFDQHPTELDAWLVRLDPGEHVTDVDFGNVAQIAMDDFFEVAEGSVDNALDVLANDLAPSGSALVITDVTDPSAGGEATIAADGKTILYTPPEDFFGFELFAYRISDGLGNVDEAQVTVEVIDVNDKPIAVDDAFDVREDSVDNVLDVLQNDYDPDGDSLQITDVGSTSAGGEVTISSNGRFLIYTPTVGFIGEEIISFYEITDGRGESDRARVTILVKPPVDLVEFQFQTTDLLGIPIDTVTEGDQFLLKGFVEDVQMDPSGVFAAYLDVLYNPTLASASGPIEWTDSVYINARSGSTATAGLIDEVGGTDGEGLPPGTEGDPQFLFSVEMTADAIGELTFAGEPADVLPRHYVLLFGSDTPVPAENIIYGTTSIDIVAIEFAARDDLFIVLEDSVEQPLDVLRNDTLGPEGGTLDITDVGTTSHGGTVVNVDGTILSYTPAPDFFGIETFTYTVTNGLGAFDEALVTVDVLPTNDPPVAVDDFFDVDADSIANVLDVLANDLFDPDTGETLVISNVGPASAGGVVTIAPDELFVLYTPAADFLGTETFTYTIDDGNGGSDSATVTVDVLNPGPLVDLSLATTDLDGRPISSVAPGEAFILDVYVQDLRLEPEGAFSAYLDVFYDAAIVTAGDTIIPGPHYGNSTSGSTETPGLIDEAGGTDGLNLPPEIVGDPVLLFSVLFSADTLGEVTFTGDPADISPAHDVTLFGRPNPVPIERVAYGTTSVTVTVAQFAAEDDFFEVLEDSLDFQLDVLANDTLGPAGGTLEITEVGATNQGGDVTVVGGLFLEYTPAANFFGTETFTYTITNGQGDFDQAQVVVDVLPVNDDPIAVDDFFEVESSALASEFDVLANDLPGPDAGETLVIIDVGPTSNGGLVEIRADQLMLLYTPAADFVGTETFTYTIGDGNGGSDTANVTVDVTGAVPMVEFTIVTTDLAGEDIASATVGEDFLLNVFITDVRSAPEGVFAAYLDVFYDAELVSVSGDIERGPVYPNSPAGNTTTPGLIDEAGGADGFNVPPGTEADAHLLFKIQMTADAAGSVLFEGNRDDMILPAHNVQVFGIDAPVPNEQIVFVDTTLSIENMQFTNLTNPLDVNNDGFVAPNDALAVINELNINGARLLLPSTAVFAQPVDPPVVDPPVIVPPVDDFVPPTSYVDVNGDQYVSPIDALMVINELNARAEAEQGELKATAVDQSPARRSVIATVVPDVLTLAVAAEPLVLKTDVARDAASTARAATETPAPPAVETVVRRVGRVTAGYSAQLSRYAAASAADELDSALAEIAADVSMAWQETNTTDDFLQS